MSLMNLTMKHGRDLGGAKATLDQAVREIQARLGPLIRRVDWDADRARARVEGVGFWVEVRVDTAEVHASGDVPVLGGLLAGGGVQQLVRRAFERGLPGRTAR